MADPIEAAAAELKFAIAEAEQQEQQRTPPTPQERQALYHRRAHKIIDAYHEAERDELQARVMELENAPH